MHLVYSAVPYGHPDSNRHPISEHLAKNVIIQGQVRICCNPAVFLRAKAVRMYTYSADPTFHKNREKYQKQLTKLLYMILGGMKNRTSAAKGIYGGKLPKWFKADDQSDKARVENEYK